MKKIKKALSLLLVGVIAVTSLFCGSVTAWATVVPVPTAEAGDKQVTLSWEPVKGATKYAVSLYIGNGQFATYTSTLTDTSYVVKNLKNGTEYKFLVQAYTGEWSSYDMKYLVSATPKAPAADIPYSVGLSVGDKPNLYYVDVGGITTDEYNFLKDSNRHGYVITLTFNKGKSDQIVLTYFDVSAEDISLEFANGRFNNKDFGAKFSAFVPVGNGFSFVFAFDTNDNRFYVPIDELKKCTECNLIIYQNEGDDSKNYYGFDKDNGITVPFTVGKSAASSAKTTDTKTTSAKKVSDLTVSSVSSKIYTGKAIKPDVTVKDGSKKLVKDTDYTLTYKNNTKIGKATVTINGKGNYSGTKTLTFKIIPAKTTLTAKKSGNGYTLSWKKVSGIDKYQIQYSTDGGKTYKSGGTATSGKTSKILKLGSGKSYTFRIRSYKIVDGKKYYSNWSKAVKVK